MTWADAGCIVTLSSREEDLFQVAVRRARRSGVSFQPGQVAVWFYRRDSPDEARGFCRFVERPIEVYVAVDQTDREVVRTILHELKHAHDSLRLGTARYRRIPPTQHEVAAEAFAEAAL